MARSMLKRIVQGKQQASHDGDMTEQNLQINGRPPIASPFSRLSAAPIEFNNDEDSFFQSATVVRNLPVTPTRAESKFHTKREDRFEGFNQGPGKELSLILMTLSLLSNNVTIPDYVMMLCVSVLSRVDADILYDVKKARSLVNIFLPALCPKYPTLRQYTHIYREAGLYRFVDSLGRNILKKLITLPDGMSAESDPGGGSIDYSQLLQNRLSPFSSCLVEIRTRTSSPTTNWWREEEGFSNYYAGWYQISQPTRLFEVNEKYTKHFDALNEGKFEDLRSEDALLYHSIGEMLATMQNKERSCFLVATARSNSDPPPSRRVLYEFKSVDIRVLEKKIMVTSGNNLYTQDLSLQRFFTRNRYSHFGSPTEPLFVAEYSTDQLTFVHHPLLTSYPESMVSIRFRLPPNPESEPSSASQLQEDSRLRNNLRLGHRSLKAHEPIHEKFVNLPSRWKWVLLTTPAETEIKFSIVDTRGKIEGSYYLIWSAKWNQEVDSAISDQQPLTTSPLQSATPSMCSSTAASRGGSLSHLRKILKLSLCDIKLEIATVARTVTHALNNRDDGASSTWNLCAAALLNRGFPLLEHAVTVELESAAQSQEMCFGGERSAAGQEPRYFVNLNLPTSTPGAGASVDSENSPTAAKTNYVSDLSTKFLDQPLGGNYYITQSLSTLAQGLNANSSLITNPLNLINLKELDPAQPAGVAYDGFYKHVVLKRGRVVFTVALVSGFSNWFRDKAVFLPFISSRENVIIELGTDGMFVGASPLVVPRQPFAGSPHDIGLISSTQIWDCNGLKIKWSLPCLRQMAQVELNAAEGAVGKDFTALWPSLCVHHIPTQQYGVMQQHIQPLPARKAAMPIYQWLQTHALYIRYGAIFGGSSGLVCTNVFGCPMLIVPLHGLLKSETPGMVRRELKSTNSRTIGGNNRTATISTDTSEEDLQSIVASNELQPGGVVHEYMRFAQNELRSKSTRIETPPALSYVIINANPKDRDADPSTRSLTDILRTEHNFGRHGLWAMLFPTLLVEDLAHRKHFAKPDVRTQALSAWAYLILTSKFGESRASRKAVGWTAGLVPALFQAQYMASIEDTAASTSLMMTRSISGTASGGCIQPSRLVCDIVDWDHLIIERNRHDMLDILLAVLLIQAECQTGDCTLTLLFQKSRSNSQAAVETLRIRLARLLMVGFETFMAPRFLELLKVYHIGLEYEFAVLEKCRQIIDGGSHLAVEPDRSSKILNWVGFLRGVAMEPKQKIWLDRVGLRLILRNSGSDCNQHLKVVDAATRHVIHTTFRAQLQIDKGAYSEVQIGSQYSNLEQLVNAAALGNLDFVIQENVESLFVEILRKICKFRRRLTWPNTLNKTTAEPDASTSFKKFTLETEFLESVLTQVPHGLTGSLSVINVVMTAVCHLLGSADFSASLLWHGVGLMCTLLFKKNLNVDAGDELELAQPEPIALRLIGLLALPLRLLSAYHHLNQQVGPALTADSLGRYTRALLPQYLRCDLRIFNLDCIPADVANLTLLYSLPIGPPSIAGTANLIADKPGFEVWAELELKAHPSLISNGSGALDKEYVAAILETNYLANDVLEAWVRAAHYLMHNPPPTAMVRRDDVSLPSAGTRELSQLVKDVLAQTSLYSAGLNGGANCLGLGGASRFLPHDPTMASGNSKLLVENNACREKGKDIWLSMASQAIFDGGNRSLGKILKIDCAEKHTVCLYETGQLLVFGSSKSGQLGFCFENRFEVLPSGLVRADHGDKRILDETTSLRKKERLKSLRYLLRALTANPHTFSIHSPLLLTLSENGRPTQISNICCGAMFTLCVANSSSTLVLFWNERDDTEDLDNESVADEVRPDSPPIRTRVGKDPAELPDFSRLHSTTTTTTTNPATLYAPLHPLYTTSKNTSISAGVSHWVAVFEDGFLLIGGENSANQVGPWKKLSTKTLQSYSAILDVLRLDCYIAKSVNARIPDPVGITAFAAAAGPPSLQTLAGGQACVFRGGDPARLFIVVARPFKNLDNKRPSSPIPSPRSSKQVGTNIECMREFNQARFLAADCGESHTVCLVEDMVTKERYGLTWGSNDFHQQFPHDQCVFSTGECLAPPGVLSVKKDCQTVLAGAASSAVGNAYLGVWSGTEINGHLGFGAQDSCEDRVFDRQVAPLSLSVSRFSVMSAREAANGSVELLGAKLFGSFLAPRFLEEGVGRLWRAREMKYHKSAKELIKLPRQYEMISIGTDHLVCTLGEGQNLSWETHEQNYVNELVFNVGFRIARKYRNLEDVINNFLPAGGPARTLKGPPRPTSALPAGPEVPEPLPLLNSPGSPRDGNETGKWLQKGIVGVTKWLGGVVTNIIIESTTTTAGDSGADFYRSPQRGVGPSERRLVRESGSQERSVPEQSRAPVSRATVLKAPEQTRVLPRFDPQPPPAARAPQAVRSRTHDLLIAQSPVSGAAHYTTPTMAVEVPAQYAMRHWQPAPQPDYNPPRHFRESSLPRWNGRDQTPYMMSGENIHSQYNPMQSYLSTVMQPTAYAQQINQFPIHSRQPSFTTRQGMPLNYFEAQGRYSQQSGMCSTIQNPIYMAFDERSPTPVADSPEDGLTAQAELAARARLLHRANEFQQF